MLLAVSRVRSNLSASAKCASSRLAEPNIRNTRSSGAKSTPLTVAAFAMRRGDMPIGEIQRANSSNTCSQRDLAVAHQRELLGMRQQRPDAAGDRLARLVLPAADGELDVVAHVCFRHAAMDHHAEQRMVRRLCAPRAACRRSPHRCRRSPHGSAPRSPDRRRSSRCRRSCPATRHPCPGSGCW